MKTVYFIRHGATPGNLLRRYIGSTDQPLSDIGVSQAQALGSTDLPEPKVIYVSPMLRCRQTADYAYPGRAKIIINDLRELDFGIFENQNFDELENNVDYRKWVDNNCQGQIPGGDDVDDFKKRCVKSFLQCMEQTDNAAFVVHGGVIMAILEALALPKKGFYDYYVKNCQLVTCHMDGEVLTILEA